MLCLYSLHRPGFLHCKTRNCLLQKLLVSPRREDHGGLEEGEERGGRYDARAHRREKDLWPRHRDDAGGGGDCGRGGGEDHGRQEKLPKLGKERSEWNFWNAQKLLNHAWALILTLVVSR